MKDHLENLIMNVKTYRYQLIILGIIIFFALFYFSRVNREFIESSGDNYTYEIFAKTVFSSHPFKINVKFDFYDALPIYHHQRSFPPLYPIFLAVMHLIFGKSMLVNFYLTSLIGVLCAVPMYCLGKLLADERVGLAAAFIALLFPALRDTAVMGMSEPLFTFFSLWFLYYLVRFSENRRKQDLVFAAVFTGLAYLTRPTGVALIVAGLFFLLSEEGFLNSSVSLKEKMSNILIFLSLLLLVVSPWLIRNYLVFGDAFYYVGRFTAGQKAGTLYAALDKPSLGNYLRNATISDIVHRYSSVGWLRLKTLLSETGILSLLVVFGMFSGYYKNKKYLAFWLYLMFGFLITILGPGLQARHLVHLFPVVGLLGVITFSGFYQSRPWHSFKDYLEDSVWPQAFLPLCLAGFLWLGYNSFRHQQKFDPYSRLYPQIGRWFKENTRPDTVIMGDPAPSIHYHTGRPLVMFPRGTTITSRQLNDIWRKYRVEYLVVLYQDQLKSLNIVSLDSLPPDLSVVKPLFVDQKIQGVILKRSPS